MLFRLFRNNFLITDFLHVSVQDAVVKGLLALYFQDLSCAKNWICRSRLLYSVLIYFFVFHVFRLLILMLIHIYRSFVSVWLAWSALAGLTLRYSCMSQKVRKVKKGKFESLLFTFYCHSLLLVTKKAVDNYMLWYHDGPTHLQTFKAGFAAEWSLAWLYLADRHIVYATQVHGVY